MCNCRDRIMKGTVASSFLSLLDYLLLGEVPAMSWGHIACLMEKPRWGGTKASGSSQ